MSSGEMIDEILKFTVSQGGHIGFKEIEYDEVYSRKFTDVSIFSDGTMRLTNNIFGEPITRNRNRTYLNNRGVVFLRNTLKLISENKFL